LNQSAAVAFVLSRVRVNQIHIKRTRALVHNGLSGYIHKKVVGLQQIAVRHYVIDGLAAPVQSDGIAFVQNIDAVVANQRDRQIHAIECFSDSNQFVTGLAGLVVAISINTL